MDFSVLRAAIEANLPGFRLAHAIPFGADRDFANRRVCLFSHYDKDSKLDDHVVHYLRALADAGLDVVLISSCPSLDATSIKRAQETCATIILRANKGYDFAGWALALRTLRNVLEADEILFTNDSVYGPLRPLGPIFDDMKRRGHPIWGLTRTMQIEWHVQSYFLMFTKPAIASPAFRAFWFDVKPLSDKWQVVRHYESMLTPSFEDSGLHVDHYVQSVMGEKLLRNPSVELWKTVIEGGSPFLKVQLLRDNPNGTDISDWEAVVAASGYDVGLIKRHLIRVKGSLPVSPIVEPAPYTPQVSSARIRDGWIWDQPDDTRPK